MPDANTSEVKPSGLRRLKRRGALIGAGVAVVAATLGAASVAFQDNIARFFINPRQPFQTVAPPPAPDYADPAAWILQPASEADSGPADVFYVHSTTYYSRRTWNAPIDNAAAGADLERNAAPNEARPFATVGAVHGPRYRQATLYAFFTHKYDGVAARRLAFEDVRAAFARYLATADATRPLVLVGYGQGGLHVQGLLQEFFQKDEKLRRRLAAAYVIDQATPLALFNSQLARTPACLAPLEIRCVVSYVGLEAGMRNEMRRVRRRSMAWTASGDLATTADLALLCVNPLTWTTTGDYASADSHLGAASATGLPAGAKPPARPGAIGARCIEGILVMDRPEPSFLRQKAWFGEQWRARSYNAFYFDLATDAARRVAGAARQMETEARFLDPIEDTVDLEASPIHKAPSP